MYKGVIERYKKYLPVTDKTPIITLYEGNTPLLRAKNIESHLKLDLKIYLKCEGFNPTGSFKDRGMTMAISKAVEEKANAVICASTGNTSASAAAYSAKAGIKCIVIIPEGSIALGKLSQAMMHGAKVIAIKGNFDEALTLVKKISETYPVTVVNSINPYRIEGQKTGSFEIIEFLGDAPDYQFMPVGNAGNITAYWKGYKEYQQFQISNLKLPRMMGFQAKGSAPIVLGKPIKHPKTLATAIKIGNPASWKQAEAARDESKGVIDTVTDTEIINAYKLLAGLEGVFAEPASAASLAGLIKYSAKLKKENGKTAICILTGHGLKDPERAIKSIKQPTVVEAKLEKILKAIKL
ncbi:MAG: threonine synthase [Elusimicrobia bacterium]|nr:threonine synthase [Elusimicrobiota bacterium]MBU2614668.1 threonine synthase [Elusimicrobiota bacterium]